MKIYKKWIEETEVSLVTYRTGKNSACMILSSEYNDCHYDLCPCNGREAKMYVEMKEDITNIEKRKKYLSRGFKFKYSSKQGGQLTDQDYQEFLNLFLSLDVEMVTLSQGNKIWALMRGMSFTSSTVDRVLGVLFRHEVSIEGLDKLQTLLRVSQTPRANENVSVNANEECSDDENDMIQNIAESIAQDMPPQNSNVDGDFDMTPNESISNEIGGEMSPNEIMISILEEDSEEAVDVLKAKLAAKDSVFLSNFLHAAGLSKIPATITSKLNQAKKWLACTRVNKPYVFKTTAELIALFTERFGHPPRGTRKRSDIIDFLSGSRNNVMSNSCSIFSDGSLEQELMNIILFSGWGMQTLSGVAKEYCEKGHIAEQYYSAELLQDSDKMRFPYGAIKYIFEVGLVRKKSKTYVQDSVDRIIGFETESEEKELLLVEMKARVKPATANKERTILYVHVSRKYTTAAFECERIKLLIPKSSERSQCLHHAYTYSQQRILFVVGSTKTIIRCVFVTFEESTLSLYGNILEHVFKLVLNPYYSDCSGSLSNLSLNEKRWLEESILKNESTFPDSAAFNQRLKLWHECKRTIPLFDCKQIIPVQMSSWNVVKFGSDIVTQMLWSVNPLLPSSINDMHTLVVRRTAIFLPVNQFHRVNQLFSTQSIDKYQSLSSFRSTVNHKYSFWDSMQYTTDYLLSMVNKANPVMPLTVSPRENFSSIRRSSRISSRHKIGHVIQLPNILSPSTGTTPLRSVHDYYCRPESAVKNAKRTSFVRYHACSGLYPMAMITSTSDRNSYSIPRLTCVICGRKTRYTCMVCKCNYCFDVPNISPDLPDILCFETGKRDNMGKDLYLYAVYSCFYLKHQDALAQLKMQMEPNGSDNTRQQLDFVSI